MSERVLITGAAGLIGTILRTGLGPEYRLTGIDIQRMRGSDVRRTDMTKRRAAGRAFRGQDAVIDLAVAAGYRAPWKDVYRKNISATINMLEAARRQQVRRVVFASSNHVTGLYERDDPYAAIVAGDYEGVRRSDIRHISVDDPVRPDGPYGVAKALGEAAARYYSEEFGLSVLCLRIGTVNAANRPTEPRHFATLLTHADLVRLVDCCLRAPTDVRFGIFYGVSKNTWRFWDIENARTEIGFAPHDDAEMFRSTPS